jgi:hypothetical protein
MFKRWWMVQCITKTLTPIPASGGGMSTLISTFFKLCHLTLSGSRIEDEMSYWLGPVFVKLLRLFINLTVSVHLFCCAYWRIKVNTQEAIVNMKGQSSHIFLQIESALLLVQNSADLGPA